MKTFVAVLAVLAAMSSPAAANGWEIEHDDGDWWNGNAVVDQEYGPYRQDRGYRAHPTLFGGYEEEIWDGDCRIERKWEADGDYREERDCHH